MTRPAAPIAIAPKTRRRNRQHTLSCVCILLATLGCQSGGSGTAATDAGPQVGYEDGARPFDDAFPTGVNDGGVDPHTDAQVAGFDGAPRDGVSYEASIPLGSDGPKPPESDGSIAVGPDGASQQTDVTTVAPDAQEAQCATLAQSAYARVVDEIYEQNITERTGGYFQPGTYALAQLVDLVAYDDPRRGTKTGRSVQETWRVRRVGDTSKWETYVDVVRAGLGSPNEQSATFHMELLRDSGPGGDDLWKLTRICGDSGLNDLEGALLDVDMPLVSIRLAWGTSGKTTDGKSWRRRYSCMGQACRE